MSPRCAKIQPGINPTRPVEVSLGKTGSLMLPSAGEFLDELPTGLIARELELKERAIRTATKREAVNEATKSALSKQVIDRLLAAGVPIADIALMA